MAPICRIFTVVATALILTACSNAPKKIEVAQTIEVVSEAAPLSQFLDSRSAENRDAREITEGVEVLSLLGDQAFSPPLPVAISKLLAAELGELKPSSVVLSKAAVGATKITPRSGGSAYRGTPYIPPGTHPGAAALGILLGEGLIYLAGSVKASSNAREAWTAELAIEIDGEQIFSLNRTTRTDSTSANETLSQLLRASVKDVVEKFKFRLESKSENAPKP